MSIELELTRWVPNRDIPDENLYGSAPLHDEWAHEQHLDEVAEDEERDEYVEVTESTVTYAYANSDSDVERHETPCYGGGCCIAFDAKTRGRIMYFSLDCLRSPYCCNRGTQKN